MAIAVVLVIIGLFWIYSWLVSTGRKAIVFTIPSLAGVEVSKELLKRFVGLERGDPRVLHDGMVERTFDVGGKPYVCQSINEETGDPNCGKGWTRITWGGKVSEFWEVNVFRPAWFGSVSTIAMRGRFQPAVYLLTFFGLVVASLRLMCATNRMPKARLARAQTSGANDGTTTSNTPREARQAAANFIKPGKVDNFVATYGNELMLSALAILSFVVTFGWDGTLMLAPIILIHEYGHLVAFRLFGHTGNRMMLVPFMGGIAIPSGGYRSEYEAAFTAIMGPAICIPVSIGLTALTFMAGDHWLSWWFAWGAMLSAVMNALNLFPALPLDGGHSFQALARSIAPTQTSAAMLVLTMSCAVLLEYGGYSAFAGIVGIWGGMEVARTWNRPSDLTPLNARLGVHIVVMHIGTFAIHAVCAWLIWSQYYY